jgi:hypothetical protein
MKNMDKVDLEDRMTFLQDKTKRLLENNQAEQDQLNAQLAEFKAMADEVELVGNEERMVKMQEQAALVLEQLRINEDEKKQHTRRISGKAEKDRR